jgi:hypothetical protein
LKNPEKMRSEINHFYEQLAATSFLQGLSSHVKVHYMIFLLNRHWCSPTQLCNHSSFLSLRVTLAGSGKGRGNGVMFVWHWEETVSTKEQFPNNGGFYLSSHPHYTTFWDNNVADSSQTHTA